MVHIVVESEYDTPLDKKTWLKADLQLLPCLQAHGAKWLRSQISIDGRRTMCEFEAPDAESVRTAYHINGFTFKRVWISEVLTSKDDIQAWAERPYPTAYLVEESVK